MSDKKIGYFSSLFNDIFVIYFWLCVVLIRELQGLKNQLFQPNENVFSMAFQMLSSIIENEKMKSNTVIRSCNSNK